jgi:flagellar hook-associated protein 3 FlgL
MRITTSTILAQIQSGIQNFQTSNSELTTQLSTGKKILAPSEDVAGTMRAMDYQVSINANNQYKNNITGATTNLNLTSDSLTGVSSVLTTLTNLISNTSGSTDPVTVASSSQQAAQVRDELYNYANTKGGGGYIFSGFQTNLQPYTIQPAPVTVPPAIPSTVYDYQGDNNLLQVPIDRGATMSANVTGNEAFSLSQGALPATPVTLSNGDTAQYAAVTDPATGATTTTVTITPSSGGAADTFSFSNAMDMANIISSAIGSNNTSRIEAMSEPLSKMRDQVNALQADVGARINALTDQTNQLNQNTLTLQNDLSTIQDADMSTIALQLTQTNTALQALYSTSAKVLPQSLFDFLK